MGNFSALFCPLIICQESANILPAGQKTGQSATPPQISTSGTIREDFHFDPQSMLKDEVFQMIWDVNFEFLGEFAEGCLNCFELHPR
jgi:hypothetical protein